MFVAILTHICWQIGLSCSAEPKLFEEQWPDRLDRDVRVLTGVGQGLPGKARDTQIADLYCKIGCLDMTG